MPAQSEFASLSGWPAANRRPCRLISTALANVRNGSDLAVHREPSARLLPLEHVPMKWLHHLMERRGQQRLLKCSDK